jgi:hypothetical protein
MRGDCSSRGHHRKRGYHCLRLEQVRAGTSELKPGMRIFILPSSAVRLIGAVVASCILTQSEIRSRQIFVCGWWRTGGIKGLLGQL